MAVSISKDGHTVSTEGYLSRRNSRCRIIDGADVLGVTNRCFYQLRKIRAIRKPLTAETSKLLVHAFISRRLDYCNSILYGVGVIHLRKLQSVQNIAARIDARKRVI